MQEPGSVDKIRRMPVARLDVSRLAFPERLTAASLQGLANRDGPRLYLDYGVYDDPAARRTNEDFLPQAIWEEKYRDYVGNQDEHNLQAYQRRYPLDIHQVTLDEALIEFRDVLKGAVVWDPGLPDSINVALALAGLEDLLVVSPQQMDWAAKAGLSIRHDLRGRWSDRLALYRWGFAELLPRCTTGQVACIEPGWGRTEFLDTIVQKRIFPYSLTSKTSGKLFGLGQSLLLLLVGGPFWLRSLLFDLRLDGLVKRLGSSLMGLASPETRLAAQIQKAVRKQARDATIFGWHTCRDDEFSFMLLLSASGLRLVPAHLATNFSFHSQLPARGDFSQAHLRPEDVHLEDKIYLTFTLSDGDQLMMMDTGQLGSWRRPERGQVPFNWEIQPLLVELAPALLGLYYESLTPNDYLVAGPSGAGYIIPPLHGDLDDYLAQSTDICRKADVRVCTSYIGDPPRRTVRQHLWATGEWIGFLSGYAHFGRTPCYSENGRIFIANAFPHLEQVWHDSGTLLAAVRAALDAPGPIPRFIGVHLFAYRTTISDVHRFVQTLDPERVKVVRADEFLLAAQKNIKG